MAIWPFKNKPEAVVPKVVPAQTVMTGQPVHLNLDPASNKAMIRSLSRMVRLTEYQTKTHLDPAQLEIAQEEFNKRRQMLLANGMNVPSDTDGIVLLIRELQAKEPQQ